MTTAPAEARKLSPGLKLAIDFGPLFVFLVTYRFTEIFTATLVFMVATVIAVAVSYWAIRRVPVALMVTFVVVAVFGGLTVWLHDERFIKMKPTIVYSLFAAALLGGLAFGKPLLGHVFDWAFKIDDEGWRKLTFRWGLMFAGLAVLNEAVWRNVDTNTWIWFKLVGFTAIIFVFALSQIVVIQKHMIEDETPPADDKGAGTAG
jgi:intracellular septation protein